jgi:hypothetical protein
MSKMEATGGIWQGAGVRPPGSWAEAAIWADDDLRREVFFFRSGGERLYGSLCRAPDPSRRDGLVICPSWGVEADRSSKSMHALAFAMARLGGAAFVFHYPGYGDSEGNLAAATMEGLVTATTDAIAEAARRAPDVSWTLAGFTFGASVACLAQRESPVATLLLLQPELRPGAYFRAIARKAKRAAFGQDLERLAFGYPAPEAMLDRAPAADAEVEAALAEFEGDGCAIRYASPERPGDLPDRFEQVTVPGTWRFGARTQPGLCEAAVEWLQARAPAVGSGSA